MTRDADAPESTGASKKHGRWLWILIGATILLPLIGLTGAFTFLEDKADALRAIGPWGVVAFIALASIAVGLALSPSNVTSLLSGYVYGMVGGFFTAMAIVLIGTVIGFFTTRFMAGDRARELVDRSRWGRALAKGLIDAPLVPCIGAVALARLPPQVPFALGNVLAASCRVRLGPLLAGTALGSSPRVALIVWVGSHLSSWDMDAPVPDALWWALGSALVGFVGLALWSWYLLRRAEANFSDADAEPDAAG